MIPIKDLNDEELTRLKIRSKSFFLTYHKTKKFNKAYTKLLEVLDLKDNNEVWVLITAYTKAIKQASTYSKLTLRKSDYTKANKDYGLKISYTRMVKVINKLHELGFIDKYVGYWNSSGSEGSVIHFKDKFEELFEGIDILSNVKDIQPKELVEVRDQYTKLPLPTSNFRGIVDLRSDIVGYNDLLKFTDIQLLGNEVNLHYKRIFINDLTGSGRWYSGSFQTVSSEYRKYITFDGEPTIELDVSAMHPSINACLLGIQLPLGFKPYDVTTKLVGDPLEVKSFIKKGLLCILYTENKEKAVSALSNAYLRDNKLPYNTREYKSLKKYKGFCKDIINLLIQHNHYISGRFFMKDGWLKLQNLDSKICGGVISRFVSENRPVLCYHDSWLVSVNDQILLRESVRESWYEVLGTYNNLQLDVK